MKDSVNKERYYVVAPNYQWFLFWCRDRKIDPKDRSQAIFVHNMRDVAGHVILNEKQIVDIGPFDQKRYNLVLALRDRARER